MDLEDKLKADLTEHLSLFSRLGDLQAGIIAAAQALINSLRSGGKILVCGNGGSAADAQHFAAELIGRFEQERGSLPAIALTTDTSILTAVGNDYGFDSVFERQVKGLGRGGDVLIGISTSGNSPNVLRAVARARESGLTTIGLLGNDGGKIAPLVDIPVIVPHRVTARIQEAHIFILHYWAGAAERELYP
jgi:D-sedoheptulose 7-phosphate isomerase